MRYLLALFLLAGLAHAEEAIKPKVEAEFRRGGTLTAQYEDTRGIFTITSPSGIGGVTLTLKDGAWPRDVVFRFHYDDARGFRLLEHVGLETSRLVVHTFWNNPDPPGFRLKNADGTLDPDAKDAGTLNMTVTVRETDVEVTLPANLLVGEKQVSLAWVDAYRE